MTNGIIYRFYSDLVDPDKMDEKPFLEINMTDIKDNQIEELNNPTPEFVKYFAKQVYPSIVTAKVLELFTNLKQPKKN